MARAFSKWSDRRKVVGANRAEAQTGWHTGVQWVLEQAAQRLEQGLTHREDRSAQDEERQRCADELRELARDLHVEK